jgi:three-Cys-motif partner protein
MPASQPFGGDWTDEKLERVRKYLVAYATIMSHYKFRYAYIDAFAGTGYRTNPKAHGRPDNDFFPELAEEDTKEFIDGSARIALQVEPRFNRYIFIERNSKRFAELSKLKTDFPALADDIILVNSDANAYLKELCLKRNWRYNRAVLFLDPFGMQVTWDTIAAIAKTQAIDLWILFPLGVGVNRMLTRTGEISDAWRKKIDMMFGATDWYDAFYQPKAQNDLFGGEAPMIKVSDFDSIAQYFVKRLKTEFAGVADNPLPLFNSRNNPLFLLCFAAGNPKGAPTAIKIAQDILGR